MNIPATQAVLWDLDGTLINTAELHFKATVSTLTKYKHAFDRATFNASFGMSDHTILRNAARHMETTAFEAMVTEKNTLYRTLVGKEPLSALPGVVQWLETFQDWGFRQVIVSTTFAENIHTLTRKINIASYFEEIISTVHFNLPSKPQPDGFLKAAEILKMSPEQCLVIEDAPAGVESARRAGMKCVAVGTSNPLENLQAADLTVARLDQLHAEAILQLLTSDNQQ
ncbi:MAG: HAD family phosphatase [Anaerolineaceae bacterium]|nr:HAD family phosphatase [Anaerolineaceae bacterium]